ncbi:hypothetical protein SAMN05192550_1838 [Flavobacterium glycines]|uniref:Transposase n=1 Tax=Flavobacterium glycines TaxID=551990 RepID=A0A1G8SLN7_9FLAO|nr:hypothetical protein SAMN05192550_1838 [Flavobacterium glycines]
MIVFYSVGVNRYLRDVVKLEAVFLNFGEYLNGRQIAI